MIEEVYRASSHRLLRNIYAAVMARR